MTVNADLSIEPDMAVGPVNTGTLILPATQFVSITTDDHVVAFTGATGGVSAVGLTGGTPTVIDANGTSVVLAGKSVFTWSGVSSANSVGSITVWTSSLSAPRAAFSTASFAGAAAATADATYIAYSDNAVDKGPTDIVVGKLDGTGSKTTVVIGAATANAGCPITITPIGSAFLILYCTDEGAADMGTTAVPGNLVYVDATAATPTAVSVSTGAVGYSTDQTGDKGWFVDGAHTLFYSALPPSGSPTQVDTNVSRAYMKLDGSALEWSTMGGALKRATTAALGTITTLTATGAMSLLAVSPDESTGMVTATAIDTTTGQSDLATVSLTAASTPATLVTDGSSVLYGPSFTEDSKIALWYDANMSTVATLHQTTLASSTAAKIADHVWNHQTANTTKILYMDHYVAGASSTATGKTDLNLYDLASGTGTLIVSGAQALNSIDVSHDRSKVIYDFQTKTVGKSGVYVAPTQ